jgi:hypothetical protein
MYGDAPDKPSPNIKLVYTSHVSATAAVQQINAVYANAQHKHQISLVSKEGTPYTKEVTPLAVLSKGALLELSTKVEVTLPTPESVQKAIGGLPPGSKVTFSTSFKVAHASRHSSNIDMVRGNLASRHPGCRIEVNVSTIERKADLVFPSSRFGQLLGNMKTHQLEAKHDVRITIPRKGSPPSDCAIVLGSPDRITQLLSELNALFKLSSPATTRNHHDRSADGAQIQLQSSSPDDLMVVYKSMRQALSPTVVAAASGRQSGLFNDLQSAGALRGWADELNLELEVKAEQGAVLTPHDPIQSIKLHGSKINAGEFLRRVADASDEFESRCLFAALPASAVCLFQPGRVGAERLKGYQESFRRCHIQFCPSPPGVEISWPADFVGAEKAKLKAAYQKLLAEFKGKEAGAAEDADGCVFCGKRTRFRASLCGHHFCVECVESTAKTNAAAGLGAVLCKSRECKRPVLPADIQPAMGARWSGFVKELIETLLAAGSPQTRGLAFCPNPSCGKICKKANAYVKCHHCSAQVCTACNVCDDADHASNDCAGFQSYVRRRATQGQFYLDLEAAAKKFVASEWPCDMPAYDVVYINPAMDRLRKAPSESSFSRGVHKVGATKVNQNGQFAWHGTMPDAVAPICHDGFDVKRRSGQAYGRGEYFGVTASVSMGYCRNGKHMLVCYLIHGSHFSTHGTYCYVVDNPLDKSLTYCMPVAVVAFNGGAVPKFTTPVAVPTLRATAEETAVGTHECADQTEEQTECQFRWHWMQDNQSLEPYTDDFNAMIEGMHDQHRHRGGPAECLSEPIRRYNNDKLQQYRIDFTRLIQTNNST